MPDDGFCFVGGAATGGLVLGLSLLVVPSPNRICSTPRPVIAVIADHFKIRRKMLEILLIAGSADQYELFFGAVKLPEGFDQVAKICADAEVPEVASVNGNLHGWVQSLWLSFFG